MEVGVGRPLPVDSRPGLASFLGVGTLYPLPPVSKPNTGCRTGPMETLPLGPAGPRMQPEALTIPPGSSSSHPHPCRPKQRVRVGTEKAADATGPGGRGRPKGVGSQDRARLAPGTAAHRGRRAWGRRGNPPLSPVPAWDCTNSALGGSEDPCPLPPRPGRPAGRRLLMFCAHLPTGRPGDVGAQSRRLSCPHPSPTRQLELPAQHPRLQKSGPSPLPGQSSWGLPRLAGGPPSRRPGVRSALQQSPAPPPPPPRGPPAFLTLPGRMPGFPPPSPQRPGAKFPKVTRAPRTPAPSPRASLETPPVAPSRAFGKVASDAPNSGPPAPYCTRPGRPRAGAQFPLPQPRRHDAGNAAGATSGGGSGAEAAKCGAWAAAPGARAPGRGPDQGRGPLTCWR
ncbi:hypothetical protein P7K49_011959 [Saguinus oedipus]|uniref:Basic proline-rich protein-like n=1 Tax=Saguinus oedipus TaxID=9490 RepID=A0ABQ9VSE6_SAGOE|nr:hypothetical protein P7K49_011959 [Saguinus oedipus]